MQGYWGCVPSCPGVSNAGPQRHQQLLEEVAMNSIFPSQQPSTQNLASEAPSASPSLPTSAGDSSRHQASPYGN